MTLDLSSRTIELQNGFDVLQSLQYLQDRVLPLAALMKSTGAIINALKENRHFCTSSEKIHSSVIDEANSPHFYEIQIQAHSISIELLEKRIQGTLKLVSRLPSYD